LLLACLVWAVTFPSYEETIALPSPVKESALLRFTDRYVGQFVCCLLSLFKRKRKISACRRILFIEFFEMGAAIMSYSALKYVKNKLPECELHVLCMGGSKESWELLGLVPVQNIHGVEGKDMLRFLFSVLGTLGGLRRKRFDLVVDLDKFTRLSAIASFLVGARQVAGFYRYEYEGLYRGDLVDIPCAFNQNAHIAKNFLALCKVALAEKQHYPNYKGPVESSEILLPSFKSDPDLARQVKERVRVIFPDWREDPLVLVNPDVGPNLPIRNYPAGHYAKVISGILGRSAETRVLLIGVPENAAVCEKIVATVRNDRCRNFCGGTRSLVELLELINFSRLLISNDNGPAHFASLTPTPIVALFSTDSPFVYGPLGNCVILYTFFHCSPCISVLNNKRSRCTNNLCLQTLEPAKVLESAMRVMEGQVTYRTINGEWSYL
jgi:ADP-heptose:LPS heptosyltransferase